MMYQLLLGFLFFLYIINNPRPKKDYILFAWIIGGTLVFQSFLGHMQAIFNTNLGLEFLGASMSRVEVTKGSIEISRMAGTLVNANRFAGFIAVFMAFPLALFIAKNTHPQKRLVLLMILFAAGMGLLGSKSRGTWMSSGLVYGIILYIILRTRMRASRTFLAYAWAILLLLVGVLSAPGVLQRLTTTDSGSVDARGYMNQIAINLIQDNPWTGVGFDNYTYFFSAYDDTDINHSSKFPFIVHNGYLYTASEYGIPALLLLLLIWYRVFRYSFRLKPRSLEPIELMAWLLPFTFFGRVIQIFFYISNPMCSIPIWFVMGLMVVLRESADKEYAELPA
jgi:O-antigen ligase